MEIKVEKFNENLRLIFFKMSLWNLHSRVFPLVFQNLFQEKIPTLRDHELNSGW